MPDLDWRKGIDFFVDQQVFIDVVHGNERVVEISAHTELTTFEQRGDDLYLEGSILFTAYLEEAGATASDDAPDVRVEHVQHRMPFDVLVPVSAQVAGLLSVEVAVPDCTIEILGPGWVHIRSVLHVDGLSASGGYTAHCGAQEAICPAAPATATEDPSEELDFGVPAGEATQASDAPELTTNATASRPFSFDDLLQPFPTHPFTAPPNENVADMAMARTQDDAVSHDEGKATWRDLLHGSDRALEGDPQGDSQTQFHFESTRLDPESSLPGARKQNELLHDMATEFSSQSDAQEQTRSEQVPGIPFPAPIAPVPVPAPVEPLTGAPSIHAHFDIVSVQQEVIEEQPVPIPLAPVEEVTKDLQMSYTATPETPVTMSASEWFWKTLNIPTAEETKYRMRFRIVQETETLDEIAARYNLSMAELLRVNPDAQGVTTGALLYIPS